ncbi:hypothetical protein BQ8794_100051 [Mesorhizobium prunaredense]|uniref:Uncharacterized protein n=1 Tax=Mesorhizobium prunaredense TaxID=1631249 RepID=A0A1R3UZV3_9HYPH|nr:hypothetical protein BQ8794_100051 [Mesorhizobium prunaredense]
MRATRTAATTSPGTACSTERLGLFSGLSVAAKLDISGPVRANGVAGLSISGGRCIGASRIRSRTDLHGLDCANVKQALQDGNQRASNPVFGSALMPFVNSINLLGGRVEVAGSHANTPKRMAATKTITALAMTLGSTIYAAS